MCGDELRSRLYATTGQLLAGLGSEEVPAENLEKLSKPRGHANDERRVYEQLLPKEDLDAFMECISSNMLTIRPDTAKVISEAIATDGIKNPQSPSRIPPCWR